MKRTLRLVGAVVLFLVFGVLVALYALFPKARAPDDVHVQATPEAIARGRYLALSVAHCAACHSPDVDPASTEALSSFAGRDFGNQADLPGKVRGSNLTPDPETGLGRWSDGEILRAVREGVGRDGRALFPMMPYTAYGAALSDQDAFAIVAYLRSLAPVRNDVPRTTVNFPLGILMRTVPKPVPTPAPPIPTEPLARGERLIQLGNCHSCHDQTGAFHRPVPGGELAGGNEISGPTGLIAAPNITSDAAFGIGAYSDADLVRAITQGIAKDGHVISIMAMPWNYYKRMSQDDLNALLLALRTTKAVPHAVARR